MTEPDTTVKALVLTEHISAPREAVFDFLVDPDKVLRWMGTAIDIDPQPGGKFWLNVNGTDIASGSYVEVDRPNRVVFTWGWEGGVHVPPASTTVTITLTSDADGTLLELRHDGLPGGPGDDHLKGWTYLLPRLGTVATGGDPECLETV